MCARSSAGRSATGGSCRAARTRRRPDRESSFVLSEDPRTEEFEVEFLEVSEDLGESGRCSGKKPSSSAKGLIAYRFLFIGCVGRT